MNCQKKITMLVSKRNFDEVISLVNHSVWMQDTSILFLIIQVLFFLYLATETLPLQKNPKVPVRECPYFE